MISTALNVFVVFYPLYSADSAEFSMWCKTAASMATKTAKALNAKPKPLSKIFMTLFYIKTHLEKHSALPPFSAGLRACAERSLRSQLSTCITSVTVIN